MLSDHWAGFDFTRATILSQSSIPNPARRICLTTRRTKTIRVVTQFIAALTRSNRKPSIGLQLLAVRQDELINAAALEHLGIGHRLLQTECIIKGWSHPQVKAQLPSRCS